MSFAVSLWISETQTGGESTGPIPASDPWGAFADDQLGLMDHLGIKQFLFMGYCIGGCFAMKLMERAPERVVAGVLVQTVGHHPDHPDYMYNSGRDVWAPELLPRRPDINMGQVERYLHDLYRARPEFVYSVSWDFARSCTTPILVLPDETPAHPLVSSVEVASLCPNAEITVFPWREPPELKARTIDRARKFLQTHRPYVTAPWEGMTSERCYEDMFRIIGGHDDALSYLLLLRDCAGRIRRAADRS
jgi:pimeloyl-ACP methyl ester carboxylesterase